MQSDFQRTKENIRLHATILSSWLRGRDTNMSLDHFQSLWGPSGGLYILVPSTIGDQHPTLQIRLSCVIPVPVPRGGENF